MDRGPWWATVHSVQRVGHDWTCLACTHTIVYCMNILQVVYAPLKEMFSPQFLVFGASLVAQMVKRLPAMWETLIRSLGQKYPLEKKMATHSSTLAWKIPWMEEPGGLQSMGSQRVTSLHSLLVFMNKIPVNIVYSFYICKFLFLCDRCPREV